MNRVCCCLLVMLAALTQSGCASVMHELQFHRINRLNRGPAPALDPEFSSHSPTPDVVVLRAQSE